MLSTHTFNKSILATLLHNYAIPLNSIDQTKGKGKQKPPQKIIKGARKPRHVPTSTFYNLKRWMSRPPMELELRRILQPKERKTMDAGRKKRLGEKQDIKN